MRCIESLQARHADDPMTRLFDHEDPETHALVRMPLSVRRKLDEASLCLTEESWQALPLAARRRLFELPVATPLDRRLFASLVGWLTRTFSIEVGRPSVWEVAGPSEPRKPWHELIPPDDLKAPLDASALSWRALDLDSRYALVEAARSGSHALDSAIQAVKQTDTRPSGGALGASGLTTDKPKL